VSCIITVLQLDWFLLKCLTDLIEWFHRQLYNVSISFWLPFSSQVIWNLDSTEKKVELCTVSGHLLLSKLYICQVFVVVLFNNLFRFYISFNAGKHKLLETLMDGMVQTTRWKKINLVSGVLRSLMLMEIQLYHTVQEWSLGSAMGMEFGLIASLLGSNMPLLILPDLQHHTMVSTGIHHFQRGHIIHLLNFFWVVFFNKN